MKNILYLSLLFCWISCQMNNEAKSLNQSEKEIVNNQATDKSTRISSVPVSVLINSPEQSTPPSMDELIPTGYSIVNTEEGQEIILGDFNGDGKQDVVTLIEMKGDSSYDQSEEVLLAIYTSDGHGQLQLSSASENLGGESVGYKTTKKLSVRKNVIAYHHQSMRYHIDIKIRYEIGAGEFMIIGKDYADYGGMEQGPSAISINYLTGLKLIKEKVWDEQTEEITDLPERSERLAKELKPLSTMNWDGLYDDI